MRRHRWSAGAPGGCGRAGGCAADVVVKATMMKETDGSAGRPAAAGRVCQVCVCLYVCEKDTKMCVCV